MAPTPTESAAGRCLLCGGERNWAFNGHVQAVCWDCGHAKLIAAGAYQPASQMPQT